MSNEDLARSLGWEYGPTGYGDGWIMGRDDQWSHIPGVFKISTHFGDFYVIFSLPDNLQEYIKQ